MRAPVEHEQPSHNQPSSQQVSSLLTLLRLPGFDYVLDIDRFRSRLADLSAVSTAHADHVLRRAARSLDHLSSTSVLSLSHLSNSLSPVLYSTVNCPKAGTRFSESTIKRAAWTGQVLERRSGGQAEDENVTLENMEGSIENEEAQREEYEPCF